MASFANKTKKIKQNLCWILSKSYFVYVSCSSRRKNILHMTQALQETLYILHYWSFPIDSIDTQGKTCCRKKKKTEEDKKEQKKEERLLSKTIQKNKCFHLVFPCMTVKVAKACFAIYTEINKKKKEKNPYCTDKV